MFTLTVTIFTLKALAKEEKVTYQYMRVLINRLQEASKPLEWRDYRFIKAGDQWFACLKDVDIDFRG